MHGRSTKQRRAAMRRRKAAMDRWRLIAFGIDPIVAEANRHLRQSLWSSPLGRWLDGLAVTEWTPPKETK